VVLLHGIWSNAATWDWAIQHDQRFTVYAEDYSTQFPNNNAAHFGANLDKPQEGIAEAVSLLRGKRIAATQADLVGHSMGGLLARLYAAGAHPIDVPTPAAYLRGDNLQKGDIHKLITLDTPHLGSELANGLFFGEFAITPLGELVDKFIGCVTCGAAADLQARNQIVTNLPESKVPSHAIVGVGGQTVLDQIDSYALLVGTAGGPAEGIAEVIEAGTSYDSAVFGGDMHDLIVSETSQKGGLSGDAVSRFEAQQSLSDCLVDKLAGLSFSDCWLAAHFTVTKENRISAHVIDLLNAPANSSWFGRFPATSTLVAH
jgi:pimeloyl-ACP methyl ester carboxylesterase